MFCVKCDSMRGHEEEGMKNDNNHVKYDMGLLHDDTRVGGVLPSIYY